MLYTDLLHNANIQLIARLIAILIVLSRFELAVIVTKGPRKEPQFGLNKSPVTGDQLH